jgi:hypothetical protein
MTGEQKALLVVLAAIGVFGTLQSAIAIEKEALEMNGSHWLMLVVVLAAGYIAGRMFPQPAQMFGLP